MRILICPDSYKGSATAPEVAQAIREGIACVDGSIECISLPVADGGEGSVSVIGDLLCADNVTCEVTGPYGERVRARYAMAGTCAYIEMAEASGLCLSLRRECEYATTYGTGELILDAVSRGARRIVVFIGGSATCDGGLGMAAALGYSFCSFDGQMLEPIGKSMKSVARIIPPDRDLLCGAEVICASDVKNVMYGELGAAFVFAPQKGADENVVRELDTGLKNLARVIERDLGVSLHTLEGGGAAGGLGAGLYAFARARMCGGFELIARVLSLEAEIEKADLVITGEGCTDYQSMMGKVIGNIAQTCAVHSKKCVLISGLVKDAQRLGGLGVYRSYQSSSYATTVDESIRNAKKYITLAAADMMREFV